MEFTNTTTQMLELLPYPAFTVAEGKILQVNQAAGLRQLSPGASIGDMLLTGTQEYETFTEGCLYLTLDVCGSPQGASVRQMEGFHLFLLDQDVHQAALQAYALAGRELRKPLSALAATCEELDSPAASRSLHQLLRLADNMADAVRFYGGSGTQMAGTDLAVLFGELMQKAGALAEQAGYTLRYTGPGKSITGVADQGRLERAVFNLLANALKFSPAGGTVTCQLRQVGRLLCFTVEDQGQGIPSQQLGNVFSRFLRQPELEDGRLGIGLGMLLIRSAAAAHGGTVLLEQPKTGGSRITMTLSLKQEGHGGLYSPAMTVDSGWDRGLVELSEVLPLSAYENL